MLLNNLLYIFTFVYLVPCLPDLSFCVRMGYEMLLPVRWGLSLHLNQVFFSFFSFFLFFLLILYFLGWMVER